MNEYYIKQAKHYREEANKAVKAGDTKRSAYCFSEAMRYNVAASELNKYSGMNTNA